MITILVVMVVTIEIHDDGDDKRMMITMVKVMTKVLGTMVVVVITTVV